MRRIMILMFVIVFLISSVACSGTTSNNDVVDETALTAALLIADKLGDHSFFDSANAGLKNAKSDFGIEFKVYECYYDSTIYGEYMIDAAESADVVFVVGFQFYQLVQEIAQVYTDVSFVFVDDVIEGFDNITSITYRQDEGAFLAGAMAALMTKDTSIKGINEDLLIGMVGGMDIPVIRSFQKGFEAGARYIDRDVEVLTAFSGDFEDQEKCRLKARELYDKGADVVFAVAGGAGFGVFEAAEEYGSYAIGVDSDQRYLKPDVIYASMVKNVGDSIYDTIKKILNEEEIKGQAFYYGLKENGVDLVYGDDSMERIIPQEYMELIENIKKDLIDGKIEF